MPRVPGCVEYSPIVCEAGNGERSFCIVRLGRGGGGYIVNSLGGGQGSQSLFRRRPPGWV